jgi:hypothetical protein
VVTNLNCDSEALKTYFDHVFVENIESKKNRNIKLNSIRYCSSEKGAYIDCDTEICGDLSPIFTCLDRFDLVLKLNPRPTNKDYEIAEGLPGNLFPYWNGGLAFFRNEAPAKKFFSEWLKIFHEFGKRSDQPAMAKAVFENPDIRCLSVNAVWNTFPDDRSLLTTKGYNTPSRIWHYRDVKDFPDMAGKIFLHHEAVSKAVSLDSEGVEAEILSVENRYRFMCSFVYRTPWLRGGFLRGLYLAQRFGFMREVNLNRPRHRTDGQFENLKNG